MQQGGDYKKMIAHRRGGTITCRCSLKLQGNSGLKE